MSTRATAIAILLLAAVAAVVIAWAGTTGVALTTANAEKEETSFGDLATDALCAAAGTSIALMPAVSFKSGTIPPGEVTLAGVTELLTQPTEGWSVVRLTGAQLLKTLERSVSRAPLPNAGFLQVSGLTVTYDPTGDRTGRVLSVLVGGTPLNPEGTYEVAMPQSLAKGGSGYLQIFGEQNIVRSGDDQLAQLIVSYVMAQGTVNYSGQGRIIASR